MNMGKKTKVALVGPVVPLRSGIAQHTTCLHRALGGLSRLRTVSFRRQYPDWLYPGQEQTESGGVSRREPGVEYLVDGLRPLSWRRAVRSLRDFRPDLVIIPWWTIYWAPWNQILLHGLRPQNPWVVFLVHNVVDHESAAWKVWLTRRVLRKGDGFLVHSNAAAADLSGLLGSDEGILVHPHPIYDQFPIEVAPAPRRAPLELLFFGFVRDYKGLDLLLEALAGLSRRDWRLSIVGELWNQGEQTCRAALDRLGLAEQVELVPRYVSDTEAARYFQRADLVVVPYRQSYGTGVVPLAYHYDKPVIASNLGALAEIVQPGRTGWLFEEGSVTALRDTLARRTAREASAMAPEIHALKAGWTWCGLAEMLLSHGSA